MKATTAMTAVFTGTFVATGALAQQSDDSDLFSELDADLMSVVWDEIRDERTFEQIDWEEIGLAGAPGNREAQRLMEENWNQLRRAARFEDINWAQHARNRDSSGGFDWLEGDRAEGPFNDWEAEQMSRVWPEIRSARSFNQINWDAVGLDRAPGDYEARRIMAEHWDSLREAENFGDINWEASTTIRESRLR